MHATPFSLERRKLEGLTTGRRLADEGPRSCFPSGLGLQVLTPLSLSLNPNPNPHPR